MSDMQSLLSSNVDYVDKFVLDPEFEPDSLKSQKMDNTNRKEYSQYISKLSSQYDTSFNSILKLTDANIEAKHRIEYFKQNISDILIHFPF